MELTDILEVMKNQKNIDEFVQLNHRKKSLLAEIVNQCASQYYSTKFHDKTLEQLHHQYYQFCDYGFRLREEELERWQKQKTLEASNHIEHLYSYYSKTLEKEHFKNLISKVSKDKKSKL